uniref:Uncharacterized protein n=1 Tax=Solibacter usitatus (strain Ellin6076) TaxID=234267 RepID=Q027R9_SOLUE
MRCLSLIFLSAVLLVRAADTGMAGSYTGEWKSDSSGSGGALHMTLTAAPGDSWKCGISFSLSGEEVKTKIQSFKLESSQLDVAYDFEVQGVTARSKLTGKWDGKSFAGRYQTTVADSGDGLDAGAWSASRSK